VHHLLKYFVWRSGKNTQEIYMPTSKPRITVTLTEYQHMILRRISSAGGRSMSGVISEFMLVAQPTLERMADAFQQLKQDREEDHQRVADLLSGLHAERNGKDLNSKGEPRAQRMPMAQSCGGAEEQGAASTPFPASETSDSAGLTISQGAEAMPYCASVDAVWSENPNSKSRDSPLDEVKNEAVYGNQKKKTAFRPRLRVGKNEQI